jgi:hypothetical protein
MTRLALRATRCTFSFGWPSFGSIMVKRETIAIAEIYVPIKRRATLEQKRVDEIAASILDWHQSRRDRITGAGAERDDTALNGSAEWGSRRPNLRPQGLWRSGDPSSIA